MSAIDVLARAIVYRPNETNLAASWPVISVPYEGTSLAEARGLVIEEAAKLYPDHMIVNPTLVTIHEARAMAQVPVIGTLE